MARKSREDWLEEGLRVLVEEGVEGCKVEVMCRRLGVTKGSFYHHFPNHRGYLEGILGMWEERFTSQFIVESDRGETARARLERLLGLVVEHFGREETMLRAWAQVDAMAGEALARVDGRRLAYLEELLAGCVGEGRAKALAKLYYATLVGSMWLEPVVDREALREMFAAITAQLPEE